jgi:hypothetical protein
MLPPFIEPTPCPSGRDAELPLAETPDGEHVMRVRAADASGNVAWSQPVAFTTHRGRIVSLVAPVARMVEVPAPPTVITTGPPVTRVRAWFAGKSRAVQRTLRYGERAVVEGTLTDAGGRAVANAAVSISERAIGVASRRAARSLRTDAKGRFSYRVATGPSRVIEFRSGASSTRVTVRVRAGVTLRTSTTRVRNGSALKFSGRVLGRQRALVTIYALGGGGPRKRIPVETVRAGSERAVLVHVSVLRASSGPPSTGSRPGCRSRPGSRIWKARPNGSLSAGGREEQIAS